MADSSARRTETFPVGVVGVAVAEEPRQVPPGDPPPLPPNAELAVIGRPHPRLNARAKVTGAIRYTADVAPQGMLIGRILRSPHAHAEVRAIDTKAAERDPRVRAIVRAIPLDDPAQAVVRYVGQPVAALAATSMAAAEEALRLIRVDYKPLPFVVDLDEARRPESAKVYAPGAAPGGSAGELIAQAGLPVEGNVRGPMLAEPRRRRARLGRGGRRRRRRVSHAGADPLLFGAARPRRRLAPRRPDGPHFDPVHDRRPTRACEDIRPAAREGARRRGRHGRRLRLEIDARQLRAARRGALTPSGRAGAAHPDPARRASRFREPPVGPSANPDRRAARRRADRHRRREPRHGWRRPQRRSGFLRPVNLSMPELCVGAI